MQSIFAHRHPSACENSLFQLGRVLVVSMISLFGTVHISANAVANNLTPWALSSARPWAWRSLP